MRRCSIILNDDKPIEVKWACRNKSWYVSKGYVFSKMGDAFMVKPSDLSVKSNEIIEFTCDYCKKNFPRRYADYNRNKENSYTDRDSCSSCAHLKSKETVQDVYNVSNVSQIPEVKEKVDNTTISNYGCKRVIMSEAGKDKLKKTNLSRRGVEYPTQCPEVKRKVRDSFYKNGTCPTSSQQLSVFNNLCDLGYEAVLNYPFESCSLDIALFLNGSNINIEYDGYFWHEKRRGKDRRRDEFLKSNGWKIIRIKGKRNLPDMEVLISKINQISTDNHKYCEISTGEN